MSQTKQIIQELLDKQKKGEYIEDASLSLLSYFINKENEETKKQTIQNLFYQSKYYIYNKESNLGEDNINELYNALHNINNTENKDFDISLYTENEEIFDKISNIIDLIK